MENRKLIKKVGYLSLAFVGIIAIIILVMLSHLQHGQWIFFHGEQITGTVIDAEIGEPIEGAIVIGMWQLTQLLGEGFGGYAKIVEVKTDKDGKFIIPSWTSFKPWKFFSSVDELAPRIVIYKPGYQVHVTSRARVPAAYPQMMTDEDLKKSLEEHSITPAKVKRLYSDEEIWENHKDFRARSNFPDNYSKEQLKNIFDTLEVSISLLPIENNLSKQKLIKDITEDRHFWVEGKR